MILINIAFPSVGVLDGGGWVHLPQGTSPLTPLFSVRSGISCYVTFRILLQILCDALYRVIQLYCSIFLGILRNTIPNRYHLRIQLIRWFISILITGCEFFDEEIFVFDILVIFEFLFAITFFQSSNSYKCSLCWGGIIS